MNLKSTKKIIIKIGSALIADSSTGALNSGWLDSMSEDIASLIKSGKEIIIVSSGSIALGKDALKIGRREMKLEEKQAAAACGQLALTQGWQESLAKNKLSAAQILLTIGDTENRRRYLNARNTIETLLEAGIVPIINENDTVATAGIRFGDNDRLAARVAQMVGADLLILLSDVDGLYTSNPKSSTDAEHIEKIEAINEDIEQMADGVGSHLGSGGMTTKIEAAKIAVASGCRTIIALGTENNPIKALGDGAKHSLFVSEQSPASARKSWIAHSLNVTGYLIVDEGAAKALAKNNSLLPAGVTEVQGEFNRGDAVAIKDNSGKELGRGLVAYKAEDARKIIGKKSGDIESILGFSGRDELIHVDDMALEEEK